MNILVTGGAGFIGTHLTRHLLLEGCNVTVLDNFSPQIHGGNQQLAADLKDHVCLINGDVRDANAWTKALPRQDVIVHLAAETGTGQSMYQVAHYTEVNIQGTALLLDILVNAPVGSDYQVGKVVVASSRAVYGEGKYLCIEHGIVYPAMRRAEDLQAGNFEPLCPLCGVACQSLPTDEESILQPSSLYGITKQMQEQMILLFAHALNISAFSLRYQNVYGPGQSLRNPYTGILAIFSNLARTNQAINIFEDGEESRDFVYINDVIEATWRCIKSNTRGVAALNVGSGERTTVRRVVEEIIRFFKSSSSVYITGDFRLGDIRHNVADLKSASELIGFHPSWIFDKGVHEFLTWAEEQRIIDSAYENSLAELRQRNLFGKSGN